jgi:hypothetical protein
LDNLFLQNSFVIKNLVASDPKYAVKYTLLEMIDMGEILRVNGNTQLAHDGQVTGHAYFARDL